MLFELVGLMEYYHPRMQLRLQLARIMILNLLNLYSLIWALFQKIEQMTEKLNIIKQSVNTTVSPLLTTESTTKLPTSTIKTITDHIHSRMTEILFQTPTEYPTDPTENYDYSNKNYFEDDELETKLPTTVKASSVEPMFNLTEVFSDLTDVFYPENDFGNFTTGDLLENSNFNMSNFVTDYYTSDYTSNISSSGFNLTDIEPLTSSYQNVQYSFSQQEHSLFINMDLLNASTKLELRKLCWETMFGQELVKLTVMDLVTNRFEHHRQ